MSEKRPGYSIRTIAAAAGVGQHDYELIPEFRTDAEGCTTMLHDKRCACGQPVAVPGDRFRAANPGDEADLRLIAIHNLNAVDMCPACMEQAMEAAGRARRRYWETVPRATFIGGPLADMPALAGQWLSDTVEAVGKRSDGQFVTVIYRATRTPEGVTFVCDDLESVFVDY